MPLFIHRIFGPYAFLDGLDARAKHLSWSVRYSGQMPLLINQILRPNASLDRLDTRAKCLSWSTRLSGQMPLLIGPNASLDWLDCHVSQPQQHYTNKSKTFLRFQRICRSCRDLHRPFKFVLRAVRNQTICLCLWRKNKFEISKRAL